VGVYIEKTAGANSFDDFFSAAARPANLQAMQEISGHVTG